MDEFPRDIWEKSEFLFAAREAKVQRETGIKQKPLMVWLLYSFCDGLIIFLLIPLFLVWERAISRERGFFWKGCRDNKHVGILVGTYCTYNEGRGSWRGAKLPWKDRGRRCERRVLLLPLCILNGVDPFWRAWHQQRTGLTNGAVLFRSKGGRVLEQFGCRCCPSKCREKRILQLL